MKEDVPKSTALLTPFIEPTNLLLEHNDQASHQTLLNEQLVMNIILFLYHIDRLNMYIVEAS